MRPLHLWIGITAAALTGGASHSAPILTVHEVTTTGDSGSGSLRQAIEDSISDSTDSRIEFQIPGDGPHVISPATALPAVSAPNTTIDGTGELGSGGEPGIVISGPGPNGLQITAEGCTVRGLEVRDWDRGIAISGPGSCTVAGCFVHAEEVGPHRRGTSLPTGIVIADCPFNVIGGPASSDANVISGCGDTGIFIAGAGSRINRVLGNRIGTDRTGMTALPNGRGVVIGETAELNHVGGGNPGEGNLISGNADVGVLVAGAQNRVRGNSIGVAADGVTPLGNGTGVIVLGAQNTVGDFEQIFGNVISGNLGDGVRIDGPNATENLVAANHIGTDKTGMVAIPNQGAGVEITNNAMNNRVGSSRPGGTNLISGNIGDGVLIHADHNEIDSNTIGLAADGLTPLGNGGNGISVPLRSFTQIGYLQPSGRNVISGNAQHGISFTGTDYSGNVVVNSLIGTDVSGTRAVGNGGDGIYLSGEFDTVGGASPEAGNVIAGNHGHGIHIDANSLAVTVQANRIGLGLDDRPLGNGGDGVRVTGASRRVSLVSNAIFANGGLGIDLEGDGVTPNDPDDSDTGANGRQNWPTLTGTTIDAIGIHFQGTFQGAPNASILLECFLSDSPDPAGSGEGERPVATFPITTDASGFKQWSFGIGPDVPPGRYVTATATDTEGNTSEFSPWVIATGRGPTAEEIVEYLLGLIPVKPEYNVNGDGATDVADVVKTVNP